MFASYKGRVNTFTVKNVTFFLTEYPKSEEEMFSDSSSSEEEEPEEKQVGLLRRALGKKTKV